MDIRAETLRRRIALYRRYLNEGVDSELAETYLRETYLREIKKAEAALAELLQQRPGERQI